MSDAKKCDTCGKLYEYYQTPKPLTFEKGVKYNAVTITVRKGGHKLDVCKSCMKGFAEQLSEHYSDIPYSDC